MTQQKGYAVDDTAALRAGLAALAAAEEASPSPVWEPRDEPDCYACSDSGCAECDGSQIDRSHTWTFTGTWPETGAGGWGGSDPV